MSATTARTPIRREGEERRLPWWHLLLSAAAALVVAAVVLLAAGAFSLPAVVVLGYVLHLAFAYTYARVREGRRWAMDRFMSMLVIGAFVLALIPLVSLLWEVISRGAARFVTPGFLTADMSGVTGGMDAGGIGHAIVGTLLITLGATVISVPIGLLTAIFLVEYARTGALRVLGRGITFLVDVMTGIPSIVAGLFALAVFISATQLFDVAGGHQGNPGIRMGIMGSVALSVLMIPTVVRSSEEMLRLVPMELREAAYALGVPKWLTVVRVVLRTAIAGLTTSVTLAIARVIGETAPLLLTAEVLPQYNLNLFDGQMQTLPTFINSQYKLDLATCNADVVTNPFTGLQYACSITANLDRAWGAALALILIVMILNIIARLVSYWFAPKTGR